MNLRVLTNNNNVYFNHVKDGHSNEKNSGAIKTLVRVAVNSDYPNTTKEKGIQQRTGKQDSGLQIS